MKKPARRFNKPLLHESIRLSRNKTCQICMHSFDQPEQSLQNLKELHWKPWKKLIMAAGHKGYLKTPVVKRTNRPKPVAFFFDR